MPLPFAIYVTSALVPSYVDVESIMGTDNEIHTHGIKSTDEIARCWGGKKLRVDPGESSEGD